MKIHVKLVIVLEFFLPFLLFSKISLDYISIRGQEFKTKLLLKERHALGRFSYWGIQWIPTMQRKSLSYICYTSFFFLLETLGAIWYQCLNNNNTFDTYFYNTKNWITILKIFNQTGPKLYLFAFIMCLFTNTKPHTLFF